MSILIVKHLELFPERAEFIKNLLSTEREQVSDLQVRMISDRFQSDGTLRAAILDLQERLLRLKHKPLLVAFPALKKLIDHLLKDIVKPIDHLLSQDREG